MPAYSPSDLAQQLSRNSTPYHDPVARVHWENLSLEAFWLPPEAVSLHGVPAFELQPEAHRRRLSHYEFLNFIEAGIWLEGIFMDRIARSLQSRHQGHAVMKYRLHELREEAGHTLMFLELMDRSGLAIPGAHRVRPRLADLFGRRAPLESLGFWIATVMGEEIPDRLNRYIRRNAEGVCPTIVEICTAHIVDEARHIAYAREVLEQRLTGLSGWKKALLRPVLQQLVRQFVAAFYFPDPRLYELAGLQPGRQWAAAARSNPRRIAFVDRCINPTLQMLRNRGFDICWRKRQ